MTAQHKIMKKPLKTLFPHLSNRMVFYRFLKNVNNFNPIIIFYFSILESEEQPEYGIDIDSNEEVDFNSE